MDTYRSPNYKKENVVSAYVRYSSLDDTFNFCEVGEDRRYDIRQGKISIDKLPPDVILEAKKRAGIWPSCVEVDKEITLGEG